MFKIKLVLTVIWTWILCHRLHIALAHASLSSANVGICREMLDMPLPWRYFKYGINAYVFAFFVSELDLRFSNLVTSTVFKFENEVSHSQWWRQRYASSPCLATPSRFALQLVVFTDFTLEWPSFSTENMTLETWHCLRCVRGCKLL